ncbi:type VI secretion system lipoprotein TssJ [Paraburkholderia sacchari]|uniref:Type VI secretion system lipoprotein TssJ n=2 Tax=Paraburkholderia sacchari TaxID=159450 RepID=A0A8T6ZGX0_9BURK|nr:type VI secretion system lipoprotein TssJ [Paraburkholderia sacchari]NLP59966.1 type VI secretion system lipoprotein TssJ [Paraburkholderia sacchari]NLP63842.1 type VI secretion system lipoprotein TssJ [Paraburkholderia sacchari]
MQNTIVKGTLIAGLAAALASCGMLQSVKDGTVAATQAVFVSKVKQMNLTIVARGALNPDTRGASLPVVLRIVQLKDDRPFATATYAQLLGGSDTLKAATLWSEDVTLGPGQTLKVSEPIGDEANFVGVAAFFRDTSDAEWSVLIPKSQWKKTDPVRLVAADRNLVLDTEHKK